MELGVKVKELRKKQGWSQKELGDKIDRKQNTISNIENGGGTDIATVKLLASVFNISIEELLEDVPVDNVNIDNKLISIDSYVEGLLINGIISNSEDLNENISKAILSVTKAYIEYLNINRRSNND